jgi:hypothetical protein
MPRYSQADQNWKDAPRARPPGLEDEFEGELDEPLRSVGKQRNCVEALQEQLRRQAAERSTAGELWQERPGVHHHRGHAVRVAQPAAGLPPGHRGGRAGRPLGPQGDADLVRQHDELPGRAGRGDRPPGRTRQFPHHRSRLPPRTALSDHDRR